MFGLGHTEILIIAVVILLIFGGKKIPELMKGIGQGIKSLRDGVKEGEEDE
jgi:sec-independent protein translocase protein TatA